MSTYKDEMRAAIADARSRRAGSLFSICRAHGMEIKNEGANRTYAKPCPWCEKKDTFQIFMDAGGTRFKCHNNTCIGNDGGDEINFLEKRDSLNRREATRAYLALAGVEHPWDRIQRERPPEKPKKKDKAKPADPAQPKVDPPPKPATPEEKTPPLISLPAEEKDENPYEAAWQLLKLTDAHRKELREKRAMSDAWIDSYGIKSAVRENATLLEPIISRFPPNVLLRAGLVQRNPRTQSLQIAKVLTGVSWNEEEGREEYSPTPIIPYVNEEGRIVLLRPHKRSLTNKRWREREAFAGQYEKLHNNLRMPFGEHLLTDRSGAWLNTCVVCEGEFKAMALRMCGIPAIAFQGIHFFRQNIEHKQAIEATADLLRRLEVREVIVVFDNEAKENKEFHDRFEAEIYARYTAECLEDKGFRALFGILPDDWRGEDGKADWDSRLAWQVKQVKSIVKGRTKAASEFTDFLTDRDGRHARIRPAPRQVEFLDAKEDVITQALHKLRHVPEIFIGGSYERELANELENWCHPDFKQQLKVQALCDELRRTHGGYYCVKAPSEAIEGRCYTILEKVREKMKELEESDEDDDGDTLRQLRAAKTAIFTILNRYPKPFTDFTARSYYKVQVHQDGGPPRIDRLLVFTDHNGVRSKAFQMPATQMGSSQELRKFFLSMGGYHWRGNQDECDKWVRDLDVHNYQKTIEEVDTFGWNKEHKFYLLGDCAVADGRFIFPDKHGIIWYKGSGFKLSLTTSNFTTVPPLLFPGEKKPKEVAAAIDWEAERLEVSRIWANALADFSESFGGYAGWAVVAGIIQHLAHAEVLSAIGGKPGLWVNGEKGSGKTKSIEFAMRLLGFIRTYGYFSLGSTKVSIERTLSQSCNLPSHIDEWRNENADPKTEDLLRNCYNEVATIKGTPNGGKGIRKSVPLNIPVVTGEDATTDTALRSRYVRITASKSHNSVPSENETEEETRAREAAEKKARDDRYFRMMERSEEYYRVGRYLFKHREQFAALVIEACKRFAENPTVSARIPDARARQVFGVFVGALFAANKLINHSESFGTTKVGEKDVEVGSLLMHWFINHGADSTEDIERDVFRKRFFSECVTMMDRGVQGIDQYFRVVQGHVERGTGKLVISKSIWEDNLRTYVLVAPAELYDEWKENKRKRGETAPIARANIQAELRTQACWVKPPTAAPRQHRYSIPGEKASNRTWWVLDYRLTDPDLRAVFRNVWERQLAKDNMVLDEAGMRVVNAPAHQISF